LGVSPVVIGYATMLWKGLAFAAVTDEAALVDHHALPVHYIKFSFKIHGISMIMILIRIFKEWSIALPNLRLAL